MQTIRIERRFSFQKYLKNNIFLISLCSNKFASLCNFLLERIGLILCSLLYNICLIKICFGFLLFFRLWPQRLLFRLTLWQENFYLIISSLCKILKRIPLCGLGFNKTSEHNFFFSFKWHFRDIYKKFIVHINGT